MFSSAKALGTVTNLQLAKKSIAVHSQKKITKYGGRLGNSKCHTEYTKASARSHHSPQTHFVRIFLMNKLLETAVRRHPYINTIV